MEQENGNSKINCETEKAHFLTYQNKRNAACPARIFS